MLAPVAFDLALRDDVGLADQAGSKASRLHLMAKRRSCQPELVGGFGERQHRSVLGRGQVLGRVVGDPSSLELGVRSTKSSGRFDAIPEWGAGDQADHRVPMSAGGSQARSASPRWLECRIIDTGGPGIYGADVIYTISSTNG